MKKEQNILRQLVKAREAIRRKHNLLKLSKASMEKALSKTFKPIVDPLDNLVRLSKNKPKIEPQVESKYDSEDDDDMNQTVIRNDDTLKEQELTDGFETADEDDDEVKLLRYQQMLKNSHKDIDTVFGVREKNHGYIIGDSQIHFEPNAIRVGRDKYPLSNGLMELLFKKVPNEKIITTNDRNHYKNIIDTTNAHRKGFSKDGDIRLSRSRKFTSVILPMFKIGGGMTYKVARKNRRMDYVYWDDPNELVDRLRLLVAEEAAGNNNHENEIISILEELREGGYI